MLMKKDRLCKIFVQVITIACIFTAANLFADNKNNPEIVPYNQQEIDPCVGRGLYKPFEWYRQIQFGASVLLKPLKERRVVKAYPLYDVMESVVPQIQSGKIKHIGILIPYNDELILTIVPIRCLQNSEFNATIYELKINPQLSDTLTLSEWFQNLDESFLEELYIISEVVGEAEDENMRWVSWAPSKPVELEAF